MVKGTITDTHVEYRCGCSFPIVGKDPLRIEFHGDIEHINLDCTATWELISSGNTKGVFQLETRFGQQYAKKLGPQNMEHLAALLSILRPGCLQAIRDGKSVTDHFILRKNGEEPVEFFHDELESILGPTFGEMIYQEQAMQIAQKFAGFDLQQADVLRKAIGKKKADIMAEVKTEFMDGCKKVGILNEDQAKELFGWIEKSQRYSFNKSHAVSYAMQSYVSAYCKTHFPLSFFTSWLMYSHYKTAVADEVKLLVNNAKMMDVSVVPPDFRMQFPKFRRYNNQVHFGFTDIKGIGESAINKIQTAIYTTKTTLEKDVCDFNWLEILIFISQDIGSTSFVSMIESGCFGYLKISRNKMKYDFEHFSLLTKKEQQWISQNLYSEINNGNITDVQSLLTAALKPHRQGKALKEGPCSNKNRVKKLEEILDAVSNPPRSLDDRADWLASIEEAKLGISLTASHIDGCKNTDQANCTISDFIKQKERRSGLFIPCQIEEFKTHITRQGEGDEMAFITVSDNDASMDGIAFPEVWEDIKKSAVCFPENTVLISGDRSNDGESFILKKMWQLT